MTDKYYFSVLLLLAMSGANGDQDGGIQPFIESCCSTGTSRAASLPSYSCNKIGKSLDGLMVDMESPVVKGQCEYAFKMCCSKQLKMADCDQGKMAGMMGTECDFSSDTMTQCCQACVMGKSASESGIECTLDGFGFGQPFDTAYHDCCRREDQIRRESGDRSPKRKQKQRQQSDDRCSMVNFCQHKCIDHDEEMKCDCYPGYRLGQDGRQCDDVDECRNPAACPADQQCVNFVGGFECVSNEREPEVEGEVAPSSIARSPHEDRPSGPGSSGLGSSGRIVNGREEFSRAYPLSMSLATTPINKDGTCPPGYQAHPDDPDSCQDTDECAVGDHICVEPLEFCSNLPGRYTCVPPEEFNKVTVPDPVDRQPSSKEDLCATGLRRASDGSCQDINECVIGSHHCDPETEVCENEIGTYRCLNINYREDPRKQDGGCDSGYRKMGDQCDDINECQELRPCNADQSCLNRPGGFECHCLPGFRLDVSTAQCVDINECAENPDMCSPGFRCDNAIGSFQCIRERTCGTGYTYNMDTGSCQDADECALGRHNCPIGYVCRNTDGSFRCERPSCPQGQRMLRNGTCVADCTSGFQFDYWKENCIDIDECTSGRGPCPDNAECVNIPGSYQCQPRLACPVGFEPDQDGDQCVDQDECLTGKHGCSYDQTCRNTNGAYVCECPLGFQLDQNRICTDIDECEYYGSSLCGQDGECVNSLGSYRCSCKAGYRPSREGACVDIDECSEMSIKCGYDSVCTNLPGSYKCSCQKGFETSPDGSTCVDVDECTRGRMYNISSPCQGECLNYEGSFKCTCPRGYRLDQDGRSCIDIDECEVAGQQCDSVDDICLNIRGGFKCYSITCPANYVRDFARKNRCVRTRSPFACPPEMSDQECGSLMRQPLTISYNYLTFPANLPIPPSGHMDLFTMRGPSFSQAVVSFKLQLVSATSDGQLGPYELASKEHFDLRTSAHNEATLSLVRLTPGPQDIQLELNVRIRTNGEFGGTSKALIFIHVSENAY